MDSYQHFLMKYNFHKLGSNYKVTFGLLESPAGMDYCIPILSAKCVWLLFGARTGRYLRNHVPVKNCFLIPCSPLRNQLFPWKRNGKLDNDTRCPLASCRVLVAVASRRHRGHLVLLAAVAVVC
ncbi:hypothetical protein Droror1_Dr00025329 [Drosera rotundifolia]